MPKRKTLTTDPRALNRDGWENLLTGAGDLNRDKRLRASPNAVRLSYQDCKALYAGNDMAARIVDAPAEEMTRKWATVEIADKEETAKEICARLDELKAQWTIRQALKWQRAYGGAGVLIGANDGATLDRLKEPLNESAIRSIDYLTAFDCRELLVLSYYDNPLDKGFGLPKLYRLNPRSFGLASTLGMVDVHESRILRFSGPVASRDELLFNQGWGESVLNRAHEVIRNFDLAWDSASGLLADFAQAVFKIKGLADAISSDREGVVLKRLQLMDLSRSYLRGIALDAESEDFERKPTPISGLAEIMDRFCNRLAAAARMPVSLLMGQAPSGLNATGQENTRYYYDQIKALQLAEVHEPLKRLVKLLLLVKNKTEPKLWSVTFPALWELDDTQKADMRSKLATADGVYLANGVIAPHEVAESRFGGDEFGIDLKLDTEGREALEDMPTKTDPVEPELDENGEPKPTHAKPPAPQTGAPGLAPSATPAMPKMGGAAGEEKLQDTALNGAQISSALEIVTAVAEERLPRDSGIGMLIEFFDLDPAAAEKIMGSVGNGFKPKPPEPPPMLPGTKPPGAPGDAPPNKQPKKGGFPK